MIASNFTTNYKALFDLDNFKLGLSNIGIRTAIQKIRLKRGDIKEAKNLASNCQIHELKSLSYIKQLNSNILQYLNYMKNPRSFKGNIDNFVEKNITIFKTAYERISDKESKPKESGNKNDALKYIDELLKAATSTKEDPQKTIIQGYNILNDFRVRHNSKKLPETREDLDIVEKLFEGWQKLKSFSYRLLNDDISACKEAVYDVSLAY